MTQITPTSEEWKQIDDALYHFLQSVVLEIDGYRVVLCLERISQFKNAIAVYVDGSIKGEWVTEFMDGRGEGFEIMRRFYPKSKRSVFSQKHKKEIIKIYGIRRARKEYDIDKVVEVPGFSWTNFNSLKRQLLKENTNIRLVKESIAV